MPSGDRSGWPPPPVRWQVPDIPIRTLLPIFPPPDVKLSSLPSLPSPPRQPFIHPSFKLSPHLVPAAYYRTTRYVPPPPASMMPNQGTLEDKMKKAKLVKKWLEDIRGGDAEGKTGHEMVLWLCVNRYYRVDSRKESERASAGKGLTLFFAHANGFHKEIWEPTIRHLLASSSHFVDEIWTWEAVQHGDSGLVNGSKLSCLYDWIDNARDILNFFTYFIPSSATSDTLRLHLPRVSGSESEEREVRGLPARNIVAIGHSFGGCTSALSSLTNPNLFSSLILIDPVITRPFWPGEDDDYTAKYIYGALLRRQMWKSRSEALTLLKKIPFFSAWDPEALEVYVECGLRVASDVDGKEIVQLKMLGLQEAVVFSSVLTQPEVYVRLPTLDEKIKLRWIMPGRTDPDDLVGPPGSTQQRVWLRPTNSSNVRIPAGGHLVPQETPKELADDIREFLHATYSTATRARL